MSASKKRPDRRRCCPSCEHDCRLVECILCGKNYATVSRLRGHLTTDHPGADHEAAAKAGTAQNIIMSALDVVGDATEESLAMLYMALRDRDRALRADAERTSPYPPVPAGPGDLRTSRAQPPPHGTWTGTLHLEVDVEEWPGGVGDFRFACTAPNGAVLSAESLSYGPMPRSQAMDRLRTVVGMLMSGADALDGINDDEPEAEKLTDEQLAALVASIAERGR